MHRCDICRKTSNDVGLLGTIWRCLNTVACNSRIDRQLRIASYLGL